MTCLGYMNTDQYCGSALKGLLEQHWTREPATALIILKSFEVPSHIENSIISSGQKNGGCRAAGTISKLCFRFRAFMETKILSILLLSKDTDFQIGVNLETLATQYFGTLHTK